jgi:cyanate lyase
MDRPRGKSKEWVAAGCLGQMTFSAELLWGAGGGAWAAGGGRLRFADTAVPRVVTGCRTERSFDLSLLRAGECVRHDLQGADPGGDGIMSAIDFRMEIEGEPDRAGDRVQIVMSGKFLPYKAY